MAVYHPQQPTDRQRLENLRYELIGQANRLDSYGGHYHQLESNRREAAQLRAQAAAIQESLWRRC